LLTFIDDGLVWNAISANAWIPMMLDGMQRVFELPNGLRYLALDFRPTDVAHIAEPTQLARVAAIGLLHNVYAGNGREHGIVTRQACEMKRRVEHVDTRGQRGPEPQFEVG